ncbi:porin [Steroidobacter sp. S1-65]|uniref:Porin n=1 Tax=Steroidobacter gossypii TaxID=2805490 RepID=A0ABS1X3N2_9GAMM|nr:porin [Steroidobacter gossypii]MBM0107837.1 porin [Steroidobacter gossypii]
MIRKLTALSLLGMAAHSASVQALDFDPSIFTVNGFGTLGAVYSSEDNATYSGPGFNPRGAGGDDRISTDVDSRLGIQVLGKFSSKLTATLQIISEQDYQGKYAPHVEWANIKYEITPDFSVRLGRTAMPSYLFSDSRKVGYAIPWVRAPHEVYDLLPITNSDGLDVSYKFQTGAVGHTLQALYGENVTDINDAFVGKAKHVWGVFDALSVGDLVVKLTYQEQKLYYNTYQTPNPLQAEPAQVEFTALGVHYDPGQYFVGGEWAHLVIEDQLFSRDVEAWYVTGGYRFGELTSYVTVADHNPKTTAFLGGWDTQQRSYALGARWDFMSKFNLKAEYQYVDLPAGSQGLLDVPTDPITFRPTPDYVPGENFSLISLQINFVF